MAWTPLTSRTRYVLTKYIERSVPGGLTAGHYEFNRKFNGIRQRVEHIIGQIKNRPMFRSPWRSTYRNAITYVNIVAHMVNTRIRLNGGNYPGYGPWSHFPQA